MGLFKSNVEYHFSYDGSDMIEVSALKKITDFTVSNKRVLVREDFNVPIKKGVIINHERIHRALPTIQTLIKNNAAVMLLSHLGRPKEGEFDQSFSLQPVAEELTRMLGQEVCLVKDWLNGVNVLPGQVMLCENVRFNVGEHSNDLQLAQKMASICDIFVMDAFATAHRVQASTVGVAQYAKEACAGPLLLEELTTLSSVLTQPKSPTVAIVGGSKISTKIQLLRSLLDKVEVLIVGGGIANTFLAAEGYIIGGSLYEAEGITFAKEVLNCVREKNVLLALPIDVAVSDVFSAKSEARVRNLDAVSKREMILDIGPRTAQAYAELIHKAGTVIWSGPVGVFEFPAFETGTCILAEAIAKSSAFSVVGGGDTVAAVEQCSVIDKIDYVSTGGGAFLSYLEDKPLPVIVVLEKRARAHA